MQQRLSSLTSRWKLIGLYVVLSVSPGAIFWLLFEDARTRLSARSYEVTQDM